jgi:DNA-binding transcriptional ArsR family regulator/uncharacterized protein YndB with AHSA1/START domain
MADDDHAAGDATDDNADDAAEQRQGAAAPRTPMDDVFKALADPTRRRLLDSLNARNGQNLTDLCAGTAMSRQSVTQHLELLEAAGLVVTVRRGRERLHHLDAAPINDIADRWIGRYHRARARALADLRDALEGPMPTPSFVYTTYIKTTPEHLWRGLTSPEFTRRYWEVEFVTDWQPGSPMTWRQRGVDIADPAQVVVEAQPYTRLAYTWHSMTPEFGRSVGIDDELLATLAAERRTTATFEIEALDGMVKLTVVHDGFDADSTMISMVSEGWPQILSALKTLMETGEVLSPVG